MLGSGKTPEPKQVLPVRMKINRDPFVLPRFTKAKTGYTTTSKTGKTED
jgi:hypothetical protein